ncbi:hypothetical protein KAW18_11545 [candidate division WOR-3 bacterium]|nr:hypothetical protein [candidate division WOR-3 bacterium]
MSFIKCTVFKPSGKYYTDERVLISIDINDFDIPDEVRKNRDLKDMIYVGKTIEHEVPFLINPETR